MIMLYSLSLSRESKVSCIKACIVPDTKAYPPKKRQEAMRPPRNPGKKIYGRTEAAEINDPKAIARLCPHRSAMYPEGISIMNCSIAVTLAMRAICSRETFPISMRKITISGRKTLLVNTL